MKTHLHLPLYVFALLLALSVRVAAAPKVMALIDEKNLGSIPTSEVEAQAVALCLEEGVPTVDQDMVRANLKKTQALLKSVGDNRGAAAIGQQYGADVILIGEAVAKPSAYRIAESKLRTYEAVVTLRAVRTDNSENLAAASATKSIPALDDISGSSRALKAAGRAALEELVPKMLAAWETSPGAAEGSRRMVLSVGGIDAAWKLKALRECLRAKPDLVTSSIQKSYTAGAAVFEIESAEDASALSESLVLDPPKGLKLQVLDVAPGSINLKAVPK